MSRIDSCRRTVETYTTHEVIEDECNDKYVEFSDFEGVIDTIEDMVRNMDRELDDIKGLEPIDNVKKILDDLSRYLY